LQSKERLNHTGKNTPAVNALLPQKIKDISRSISIRSTIDRQNASYASTRIFITQRKFINTREQLTKESFSCDISERYPDADSPACDEIPWIGYRHTIFLTIKP